MRSLFAHTRVNQTTAPTALSDVLFVTGEACNGQAGEVVLTEELRHGYQRYPSCLAAVPKHHRQMIEASTF
jgi:hypothetical protein